MKKNKISKEEYLAMIKKEITAEINNLKVIEVHRQII